MHDTAARTLEYRFNYTPAQRSCPVCSQVFEPGIGMWPFIAGTTDAVCGALGCADGEDVTGPQPCNVLFEFDDMDPATVDAIRAADADAPVAERLRTISLLDTTPEPDRNLLQLAAIDLQYCQADDTQIERYEPRLVLRTCGEAAAEMLLSCCGDIVHPA
ncbi:MAG: hypothetical protein WEF86_12905 [Gemmatimonadota bacterium]